MKTLTILFALAALVAAAPAPEGIIVHPSMNVDQVDMTPEQYKAQLTQMLLDELPDNVSLNDLMSVQQINSIEQDEINSIEQDEVAEYKAALQEMLENGIMEENSLAEDAEENSLAEDAVSEVEDI